MTQAEIKPEPQETGSKTKGTTPSTRRRGRSVAIGELARALTLANVSERSTARAADAEERGMKTWQRGMNT